MSRFFIYPLKKILNSRENFLGGFGKGNSHKERLCLTTLIPEPRHIPIQKKQQTGEKL